MIVGFIILFIVVLDQISKYFAAELLQGGATHTFIHGVLSFHYHENRGAAWGMLEDHRWVFMSVSIVAIVLIFVFFFLTRKEKRSPLIVVSLSFFAGGGIGNMIDRIFLGYVIDFLRFDFVDFPIFNIADSFITVGACIMILYIVLETIREYKAKLAERKKRDG